MESTLLLTGFAPFGGDSFNPSGALAEGFDGARLEGSGAVVRGCALPVSGPAAWSRLERAIRAHRPRWVLALGVSGRECLSVETTAWNEAVFSIPDNTGHTPPPGSRILARGPERLMSGVGLAALAAAADSPALPAELSGDPGRYVCNWTYYRLLHLTRRAGHSAEGRAVFVHIPPVEEMHRAEGETRRLFPMTEVSASVKRIMETLTV